MHGRDYGYTEKRNYGNPKGGITELRIDGGPCGWKYGIMELQNNGD